MKHLNDRGHSWDTCTQCGKDLRLTVSGQLIRHGPRNNRCPGSGHLGQCVMGWIDEASREQAQ